MTTAELRDRLVTRGVSGNYGIWFSGGLMLALLGAVATGYAMTTEASERAWQLFHVNWLFFTGLTGGSLALNAAYKLGNAKWSGVIIRFSQATVFFAAVSLAGLILIFTLGYDAIYGHMQEQLHSLSHGKALWLSKPFMFARLLGGLLFLYGIGWALVRADLVPDVYAAKDKVNGSRQSLYQSMSSGYDPSDIGRVAHQGKINRLAAIYVVSYAIVFSLVAFDGIMALQPHWFSNLLGGWFFMGSFLGAHTLLALLALYGRKHLGIADLVTAKQRHDLGKMIFGFTVFWAYLMWAQFLVIWYGNMPEETGFVFARLWGEWVPVARAVLIGIFLAPFCVLLFVAAKKSPFMLGLITLISLCALWLERYILVMPSVTKASGPVVGLSELGPTALMLGLFCVCYALFARRFPMVSPRLAEIALKHEHFHGLEVEH